MMALASVANIWCRIVFSSLLCHTTCSCSSLQPCNYMSGNVLVFLFAHVSDMFQVVSATIISD